MRRQIAFFALALVAAASLAGGPGLLLDRPIDGETVRRTLGGTLLDAAADARVALVSCSLFIAVGCVLLMPLCDDRWVGPRSATPPWSLTGRVWSFGRWKWAGRLFALLGAGRRPRPSCSTP